MPEQTVPGLAINIIHFFLSNSYDIIRDTNCREYHLDTALQTIHIVVDALKFTSQKGVIV